MSDNNKVVKFKKRKNINIGIIVFVILFIYIAINVYIYFTKDQLSIYEVHEGSTAVDNRITSLILREEQIVYSDKAGYVSYYHKEGARIAKNATVYSINDSGQMSDVLAIGDVPITLSKQNSAEILHSISNFRDSFSDEDYSIVYKFKENAQSTVLDILNSTMINNEQALLLETGQTYSYDKMKSDQSGIISYFTDGFETTTQDTVTMDMYQVENYSRTSLRTSSIVDQNIPLYKMITSDEWSLILPLTTDQYDMLKEKTQVSFTILEDDFEMTAALTLTQKGDEYFAELTMNKYLSNYLSDRYLDVELDFDTKEGLKIPLTSIIDKEFYLVPLEYFTKGADSTDTGLIVETYNEKTKEIDYTFMVTDIYYQDDAYAYVDTMMFESGTYIHYSTGTDRYALGPTNTLTGVYNVNLGYAVFKRIEILYQNNEYCIISDNTQNGLSAYDQIALDGKTAVDQAIIY